MKKRLAGTGLAIGLVAGAGAGLVLEASGSVGATSSASDAVHAAVLAATTPPDTSPDGTTPDTTAPATPAPDDNGPSTAPARPDRKEKLQQILQPLIDDGTITQAQADKIIAAFEAAGPIGPGPMGRGFGDDGPMGRHGPKGIVGLGLDVVATTLGISEDEVRTAVESGQSLADLAVSKGKTAQDLIDALVKEATTRINAKVTSGDLTQAQADKMISELTSHIPDLVNNKLPIPGPWMGGHHFGGHPDNDGDDAPDTTTPTTVTG